MPATRGGPAAGYGVALVRPEGVRDNGGHPAFRTLGNVAKRIVREIEDKGCLSDEHFARTDQAASLDAEGE